MRSNPSFGVSSIMEEWRPVVGWEELYEVSDLGRIRRLPYTDSAGRAGGIRRYKGWLLNGEITHKGYRRIGLQRGGEKQKRYYAHILVLTAFRGPRPPGKQCRHLDGNHLNNSLSNLKWGSALEQVADKKAHGTHLQGETAFLAKLKEGEVLKIRGLLSSGMRGTEVAKLYNVHTATISMIKLGKTWKHI
jgi:hypothetical protein